MKATLERIENPRQMSSVNYFERTETHFPPFWHFHPEIELTFILKGKGIRYVGNSIEPFDEHDLVLLGSNLPHQWVSHKGSENIMKHAFVFQFLPDLYSKIQELESLNKLFSVAKYGLRFPRPSEDLIFKILNYNKKQGSSRHIAFIDILTDLWNYKSKIKLADQLLTPSKAGHKISEITAYILDNLERKISVKEVSALTNLQPESFCRWFKKQMGLTFVNFVNKARIENALQLLVRTDLSISQIAYASGFDTLAHFNRTFKRHKQESPRRLRERLKTQ